MSPVILPMIRKPDAGKPRIETVSEISRYKLYLTDALAEFLRVFRGRS